MRPHSPDAGRPRRGEGGAGGNYGDHPSPQETAGGDCSPEWLHWLDTAHRQLDALVNVGADSILWDRPVPLDVYVGALGRVSDRMAAALAAGGVR